MSSSTSFWLATPAVIILIACYILFLVKFKSANESSNFSDFSKLLPETTDSDFSDLLQEPSENLLAKRRRELLEKIKEERIKEYLDHKKRR
jgi:hypothetical protein